MGENLIKYCRSGDLESARYSLEQGVDVDYRCTGSGSTPLMHAAQCGQLAIVKFLVESGALTA